MDPLIDPISSVLDANDTSAVFSTSLKQVLHKRQDMSPEDRTAILQAMARDNPRREARPKKGMKDYDHSDVEEYQEDDAQQKKRKRENNLREIPKITNENKLLAIDEETGHVLVGIEGRDPQWLPYMLLRFAMGSISNKQRLYDEVRKLKGTPIPPEYDTFERPPIDSFRRIIYTHYFPKSDRGPVVMYLLNHSRGLARVQDLIPKPELIQFIEKEMERIDQLAGHDKKATIKRLGLDLAHGDIFPQLDGKKEYRKLYGDAVHSTPRKKAKRVLSQTIDSEMAEAVAILESFRSAPLH